MRYGRNDKRSNPLPTPALPGSGSRDRGKRYSPASQPDLRPAPLYSICPAVGPHFISPHGDCQGRGARGCPLRPSSLFTFMCEARRRRGKVRTAHPGLTARSRFAPLPLLSPEKRYALSRGPRLRAKHVSAHCFLLRKRTGETVSKTISFSRGKKKRFLESKEKEASRRVRWSQIGIRRPGFTPPLWSSPVYGRLPQWNRDRLSSYPRFFRRLRG